MKRAITWRRFLMLVTIIAVSGGLGIWYVQRGSEEEALTEDRLPRVEVMSLSELAETGRVEKITPVEAALAAPLVARVGGRVTAIEANLGDAVKAGEIVVRIDGENVASPARIQAKTAVATLAAFEVVKMEAEQSAELAVELAELSLEAARVGRQISLEQLNKSRVQADLQVRQAELAFEDAVEADNRMDAQIRATDIALKAAKLAQDQATIARGAAREQTAQSIEQAQASLAAARAGRESTIAELKSQRVQLTGQAVAASEQVEAMQVSSVIDGEVTKLTVKEGDVLSPGQVVGEVFAAAGANLRLHISTGLRRALKTGQSVPIKTGAQEFSGVITGLAKAPDSGTALWQVDIHISTTPELIHPGDLAAVEFSVLPGDGSYYLPLDAIVLRQNKAVVWVIGDDNVVQEEEVEIVSYAGNFAEVETNLEIEKRIVVSGNRAIREGDRVEVSN